jgi:hypothetical protein
VVQRGVDVGMLLPPRPTMELGLDHGLEVVELATQHVAEQVVVAIPLAAAVERDEEQVRGFDLVQHASRVGALQHRVAHSRRKACEDGGADQELS